MYRPPQVTEREPDGSWEDCTWASGVMLGNAAYAATKYPPTQAEYEALRMASGDTMTGGSNMADLVRGMAARWGWAGGRTKPTFGNLWALLVPGVAMVVQGSMGAFAPSHRLNRWDPGFRGGHAAYAQREAWEDRVWWMNPLAPKTYAGEWITKDELRRYFEALPGAEIMFIAIGSRREDEVGLKLRNPGPVTGIVRVKDDGVRHAAINVAEPSKLTWLAAGASKPVVFMAQLATPWPGHPSGLVYGVGDDLAVLLKEDVDDTEVQTLAGALNAAILADRARARITYE